MKEGQCPFLEVTTVTFCKAFPMRKMIPVDKNSPQKGMCNGTGFRKCMTYKDRGGGRVEECERIRGFSQKSDYYLHPRHVWVSLSDESRTKVKVGIDDFAQKLIGKIDRISLPAEGSVVKENSICMILHAGPRTVRMVSPLDGVVLSTNTRLTNDPSAVNRAPYEDCWILSMSSTGEGIKRLFHGGAARSWFEWEVERLQRLLSPGAVATAADGGECLADLGSRMNEAQWDELSALFFG
jgi:glycine cleavage system H lipoate-binding protein